MSLQKLERGIANRKALKHLNAYIHALEDVTTFAATTGGDPGATLHLHQKSLDRELVAVKDNICTLEQPTTCASSLLKGFTSPYEATVVKCLKAHQAIIAGKTNLDEFGMGSHSVNSAFGPVFQQPRHDEISVGGSSGGSALAVATEQCLVALGTDTGGSVRLPAAYTGVYGFKPSYGSISRHGVVAYANSFDAVGIMSRELEPLVQIFDALGAENDPQDPTNLAPVTRHRRSKLRGRLQDPHGQSCYGQEQKLRVGVPIEYNLAELDDPIRSVWRETLIALASEGHSVIPVSLPTTKVSLPAYYILAPAEASSNLAKYDGVRFGNPASGWPKQPEDVLFATTRGIGMGDEVRRRILLGSFTLSASAIDNYFIKAQRIRRLVQQDFDRVFSHPNILLKDDTKLEASSIEDGVDILLTPTAPSLPPRLEDLSTKTAVDSYQDDVFTVPASLAGLPAMSIPATKIKVAGQNDDQLRHIGLQIIAQYGEEQRIFQAARILENLETGLD